MSPTRFPALMTRGSSAKSEERRGGEEGRFRGWPDHLKKKKTSAMVQRPFKCNMHTGSRKLKHKKKTIYHECCRRNRSSHDPGAHQHESRDDQTFETRTSA